MKILEITAEPIIYGGQERFIANLIRYGADDETRFDVLTPYFCVNEGFRSMVEERGGQLRELGLPFRPGKSRRLLLKPLTQCIRTGSYDVVHIHSGSTSALAYAAMAARRAGAGKVFVHSHCGAEPTFKRRVIKALCGRRFKRCGVTYLACSREAGEAKFTEDILRSDMTIIQNGINVDAFAAREELRHLQRRRLGIDEEAFVIGHVGRFEEQKNHAFLLDVFAALHERMPDAHLLLVGDGSLAEGIRQRAGELGLDGAVTFTGNVDNVDEMYQAMDVFAFPSRREGLPFAVLEAQAAGLPCVISPQVSQETVLGENVATPAIDRDQWVRTIEAFRGTGRVDNSAAIRDAGFDIAETVKRVKELYRQ